MTRKSRQLWNRLTQAMTAQAVKTDVPQSLRPASAVRPLALEQRFMFDGAAAVDVAHAATDAAVPGGAEHAVDTASALRHALTAEAQRAAEGSPWAPQRQEVVFIDGQVSNVGELLTGLSANAEVVILDPNKDGLQQIAAYLQGREGLDAIHLLSHGADGTVQLGNVWLASNNLAEHRAALESIGAALKADGDLMLYGCRVGDSSKGQAFIDDLASITGADVAASSDDTGAAALGGNWTLERSSGVIETATLTVDAYDGLLVTTWITGNAPLGSSTIGAAGRVVVGDFDGDGDTDILYQTGANGSPWAYSRSNGNGTFTQLTLAQSPFAGLALPDHTNSNYFFGDFDGDGDIDVLVGVNGTTGMFLRNDNGVFSSQSSASFPQPAVGSRMVVGDFDNDGDTDILYQTGGSGSAWAYARSEGGGNFTILTQGTSPFAGLTLPDHGGNNYYVADFDGDGDLDILAAVSGATGTFLRNNGSSFSSGSTTTFPAAAANGRLLVGDFDGDGDADILYQTGANGTAFQYARSNGDGTFTILTLANSPLAGVPLVDHTGANYRVGDFDGDGDLDIFSATNSSSGNFYVQNGSPPEVTASTPSDNATGVSRTANIVLTFSESVTKGTGNLYIVRTSDNVIVETIPVGSTQIVGSGTTWTIDPSITLAAGTSYALRADAKTFVDADGIVFKGIQNNTTLNFATAANAAPVIANLNGDAVSYTEGSTGTRLDASGNATVTDADTTLFTGGKVTASITSNGVSGEDVLFVFNEGTGPTQISVSSSNISYGGVQIGTFTGGTAGSPLVITLNGAADATAVTALVRNLTYRNTNDADIATPARTVQVTISDGTGATSAAASVTVGINAVNDAPNLTATGANPTFTENGAAAVLFSGTAISTIEAGQTITGLIVQVSNLADGSLEKLVIDGTTVTLTNLTSVTTGTNGLSVSVAVSGSTATVTITHSGLSTTLAQTIVNNIAYRNDSESPQGASRTTTLTAVRDSGDVANGGTEIGMLSIASVVTLVSVNDAPTLAGGPYVLPGTNEDTTSTGTSIATMLAGLTYGDLDTGAQKGIAVTAVSGSGSWQYSTNGVTGWTNFGTVSTGASLLLAQTTYVRFVPGGANGETATLTFRAWDQTSGLASSSAVPRTADTSVSGGSTAFSSGTASASLTVTDVNDAPVLTPAAPTLPGLTDGAINNSGVLVGSLYGGNYTDVDTGALKGIAITSLNSGSGTWQYSLDGTTWSNVGTVSASSALLLRASDHVRFVPDGINGTTASVTFRAWDQTGASAGQQGTKVDASAAGGTTAFSTALDTASVTVTAVNDAPTMTSSSGTVSWAEGNNTTSTPVVIDSGVTIADPDGPDLSQATVIVSNHYVGQDQLGFINNPATMGNIIGSWDATTGVLTLTSVGNQASLAQWQAALRSVTYTNLSENPTTTTRNIEFQVTDGGGLAASAVTRSVTLTAVNDSPIITAPSNTQVVEDIASVINLISISDVDSSNATVTLSVASGTLNANSGSGVTVGGTSSALTLTGTITDINSFIASNKLSYTTAANGTANVTLTISVDTGSVSTTSTTMTLTVNPVNDTPVATVPPSIGVVEDVPGALTGISFSDVDAGSASVTATFSVPSGTLTATSGSGVTVLGSGTGALTLSGSLSDINAFIAASAVKFQTALNSTSTVTLTVSINDNGNTGGSAQTDSKTVSLVVDAVNDAPVNTVPGSQSVPQDSVLTFSTGNGNAIVVSDVDLGGNQIDVTLTATNGLITLSTQSGLGLLVGTGTGDATVRFVGSLAAVNAALDGLTFTPTAGYNGVAALQIYTTDNGSVGTGGAQTDTDVIAITVAPLNPNVTNVSVVQPDRAYKVGEQLTITVTFDMNVTVANGIPTLLLETGLIDRLATYVSGSGSNTLSFSYTVQAGDVSADLNYNSTSALQLNGATIQSVHSDNATLTLPALTGNASIAGQKAIVIDGVVPTISNVASPADGTYILGQNLDFTVNFSENVVVDASGGTLRIEVTLDTGGTAYAEYVSGSGTSALVFRLTVATGQMDINGITVGNNIQLNGGSLRDLAGNDSATAFTAGSSAGILVDGVVPTVASVSVPAIGSYKAGHVLSFTVNASEAVFASGSPRLALDVGGTTRYATLVAGSSSGSTLVFQYTVQAGDNDNDGISVGSNLDLNGGSVKDAAGNDLTLTLNSVGSTTAVLVDTGAPSVTSIVRVGGSPSNSGSFSYTVTFSEDVSGVDISDFTATFGGTSSGSLASVTQVDGHTYTVVIDNLAGAGNVTLSLNGSGTGIRDAANNAVTGGLVGQTYVIDRVAPTVTSVGVPGNGTYVAGQNLDFTVNLSENTTVDTTDGTPRIQVTLDNGETAWANYVSGSGSNALVFRLDVVNGQLDTNGVTLGSAIDLNGGTVRDGAGNDAVATLNSVGDTSGVKVDAVVPVVDSVGLPANGSYKAGDVLSFTVNTSEGVVVDTLGGTPRLVLTVGGVTRYATYVSGAAGGALVFQYTVQSGDTAASGISVNGTLDLNGGHVNDPAGNALNLNLGAVGNTGGVLVDTTTPYATNITRVDTTPNNSGSVSYTVTFSENVSHVDNSDFNLIFGGSVAGSIESVTAVDGKTFTVKVSGLTGTGTVRLDLKPGTDIADAAGNLVPGGRVGVNYAIDRDAPSVTGVDVPANGTYVAGQNLDFTVHLSENVQLNTSGGSPRLEVLLDNGQTAWADYVSGAGTSALVFRLTVATGQLDTNGITVGNTIQLNGATLRDSVGNDAQLALNGLPPTDGVLVDAVAPVVSSVVSPADGSYKAGDILSFSVNASESLLVSGSPRLVLDVGGATRYATLVSGSNSSILVFQYTVQAGDNDANGISVSGSLDLNGGSVCDAAGNDLALTLNGLGATSGVIIDTVLPTATIVVTDNALAVGETSTVTVTFSEAVSGLTTADFSVGHGTLSNLSSSDGGITWTATLTPTAGITNVSNLITLNNTGYADAAGNTGAGATDSNSYAIDTQRPTAAIVVTDTALAVGQSSTVTITFSEAVTGLDVGDFIVANGSLSNLSSSDGGITWTATLTPAAGITNASNLITLNSTGYVDAAANTGAGATDSNSYAIDTQRPTATIVVADTALAVGETSTVTITFSEVVSGLTTADFSVGHGVLSNLSSSDGGITWTATLTPTAGITNASNLITLNNTGYVDAAGNIGTGTTDSNQYAIDTQRPTATIVVADTALAVGETSTVTITFSEAVTGLDLSDFSVQHGVLSHLASSDGGLTWTATLTPTAGITNVSNLIALNNTGYVDAAGNTGSGTTDSNNYAIDTQRPTATIVVNDTALAVGETTSVTITFSEAVSGLDIADFSVEHGVLSNLSSSDGVTWTATLTPTASITDASNVITLNNTGYVDAAGNIGTGTTDSNQYAIDTQRPTATIVVADTALAVGETSTITITFSEAVSGLTTADFSVEHGTLSNLSSSDGGLTWTATLTPTAGITNASNLITLNNTGYVDAAGNSGTGTTASNVYAIDTLDPVAPEITLDQATLVNGRQVSPTGLVIISGLEAGGSWQYSLDNGVSWIEGRGNAVQLPALGAFNLWVQQKDAAGNASPVTSLNGIVEPLVPPAVQPPGLPAMNDLPAGPGLAPFQASEVSEPNADFLQSTSTALNMSSQRGGMHGSEHWSGYGVPQSIAGVNDWVWASLFAPAESNHSGFDPATEQFSVSTGASILDLKPVLLASDSPWDIESLRFSFADRQELPGWVRLDRQSGQLTIHAPKDLSTTLVLQIKVSDGKGHESVRTVKVVIGEARATSSAPAGRAGLSEKMANAANQQAGKRMSMYVHG
ncbi:Ig-like domain-containing protein [Comamonas sp.]|uniref:Ig-like domain-containing protein n=1 Tax=Comamonas sp. TaxID=34028 RepID=UPI0025BB528E|nr:Ig-like domain-containing protein [Comamonas sp.]